MALRKIVEVGDSVLTKKCREVTEYNRRLHVLLDDMRETLLDSGGVGLAAPQVGVMRRAVLVMDINRTELSPEEQIIELVNPVIVAESEDTVVYSEGCLSIPGIYCDVTRPKVITVEYYNEELKKVSEQFDNFAARMIQHELSHLDGDLFTDHTAPIRRKMIAGKLLNIQKGKVHPHYNSKLK